MSKRRISQAVVLIHGIGEQRPMGTLRPFVDAVLEDVHDGVKYYSKPDAMSDQFELRKLQNRKQPRTHFYEYYWADKSDGTRAAHVFTWLWRLLRRKPWTIPTRMLTVWLLAWALVLSIAYVFIVITRVTGLGPEQAPGNAAEPFVVRIYRALSSWSWWTFIAPALLLVLQYFFLKYVGDAARYLSPAPQNIRMRRNIRREGIALLRKIQESGDYERIILVGHSLGSVIAYDILTHLWLEYNESYKRPTETDQPALAEAGTAGEAVKRDGGPSDFRDAQTGLWQEMRGLGNPWLVTDLITLGSPLAHAALLLADDKGQLREKQSQREFPTCPPVPDAEDYGDDPRNAYGYKNWTPFETPSGDVSLWTLHHAAQFACTRWTNLYFPARLGLFGDIVGGPMRDAFGDGIKDVAVTCDRWRGLARFTIAAHVSYWWHRKKGPGGAQSLERLKDHLNLAGEKVFDHLKPQP
jgi:hypothetical protein